jgi:hypothetical protein
MASRDHIDGDKSIETHYVENVATSCFRVQAHTSLELLHKVVPGHDLPESKVHQPIHAAIRKHNDLVHDSCVELDDEEHRQAQCAHQEEVLNAWNVGATYQQVISARAQPVLHHTFLCLPL